MQSRGCIRSSHTVEAQVLYSHRICTLPLLLIATFVLSLTPGASAQDRLSVFMQRKLGHAEKTLEGLVREDYDAIVANSQAVSLLCEDELWAVLQTVEYRERSNDFRRSVNAITEAARQKNLEAATLAYVDATLKCVSCHKYVRKTRDGR
jgi:cytochrome c556